MSRPLRTPGAASGSAALALFGLLCLSGGLAGLTALAVAVYGGGAADRWALRLGLGGSVLASAVAQTLVLVGGWALWRGLRRG
jgi:hypothetical protein